jgi:hypothetical protein
MQNTQVTATTTNAAAQLTKKPFVGFSPIRQSSLGVFVIFGAFSPCVVCAECPQNT